MPPIDTNANAPLFIVLNASSGHQQTSVTRETIEGVLKTAGRAFHMIVVDDPAQLGDIARKTVVQAQSCQGIVVAAGGDGTINEVAQATLGSGCAFGVLAQGTFNYFSRTHGLPDDTAEGTRLLLTARPQPVQVGLVNDRVFLVNASLGLYPRLLEDREEKKRQYGRSRMVAFGAGLITLLQDFRPLRLRLDSSDQNREVSTPTLFVGNNKLQLEQLGIEHAEVLETGELAAITVTPVKKHTMLWLLLCGALGRLGSAAEVMSMAFTELKVTPKRLHRSGQIKVATDGEIVWLKSPLVFRVSPDPLYLLKPEPAAEPAIEAAAKK